MGDSKNVAIGVGVVLAVAGIIYVVTRAEAAPPVKTLIVVDTTPVKGGIYLNGAYQGIAPITLEVDPETYTVGFDDIMGYRAPEEITVTLIKGERKEVVGVYEPIISPEGPEPQLREEWDANSRLCPYCGQVYASLAILLDHVHITHPGFPDPVEVPIF